jgi:carbon-monoxide dehydrogenase medium subunit
VTVAAPAHRDHVMPIALRSRRHIAPFTAYRPTTIEEAVALRTAPGQSAYLAGGVDLIDWLKHGHVVDRLIRLDGVPGIADITAEPDRLRLGGCATHAAIAESHLVRDLLPDLASLWQSVANPRVRFVGTIGGNVMAQRSEYDGLPALLVLGATADTATAAGVPLEQLPTLGAPLVTGFVIPEPRYCRLFADRSLRPAVAVWLGLRVVQGQVTRIRLAVGLAHPTPVCITLPLDLPVASLGAEASAIGAALLAQLPEPASDGRASAGYRRRMVGVLARRLVIRAGV